MWKELIYGTFKKYLRRWNTVAAGIGFYSNKQNSFIHTTVTTSCLSRKGKTAKGTDDGSYLYFTEVISYFIICIGIMVRNLCNILFLQTTLGDNGVLLYPVCNGLAHYHHQVFLRASGVMYTMIFNILGMPATTVPMGLYKGLPVGIQVNVADFYFKYFWDFHECNCNW